MVKRNNRRRRRPRPKRSRRRMPRPSQTLSNPRSGLRNVHAVRGFNFFPAQIDKTTGEIKTTWLDNLAKFGAVAMKLFGILTAKAHQNSLTAGVVVTSSVQSFLLGAEDLLYSHPLATLDSVQRLHVGYTTARIKSFRIVISMMGAIGERAGRIAALLIPLTREQALEFQDYNTASTSYVVSESTSFEELTYMPGAKVGPASKGLSLSFIPNSAYTRSSIEIGSFVTNSDPIGGLPIVKLVVGYQDLASNDSNPETMYSLKEAVVSVEVQASMDIDCPSTNQRYIRLSPHSLMPVQKIKAMSGIRSSVEVDTTDLRYVDGMFRVREEKVHKYVDLTSALGCVAI